MRQFRSTASVALYLVSFERISCVVADAISAVEPSSSSGSLSSSEEESPSNVLEEKRVGAILSESKRMRLFSARELQDLDHSNGAHDHGGKHTASETAPLIEASAFVRENNQFDKERKPARPAKGSNDVQPYATMHMSGFHCSARKILQAKARIIYLGLIKLETLPSLLLAILLSFGISFGLEYVGFRRRHQLSKQNSPQRSMLQQKQQQRVRTAQHAIVSFLSHVAMLVAMTYSLELMIALVAGHMSGHYLFNSTAMEKSSTLNQTSTPSSTGEDEGSRLQPARAQGVVPSLRMFCLGCIQVIRDPFGLLVFPAARERIRRQAHPKRGGGKDRNVNAHQQEYAEDAELEESTTRDEEDLPLLRKREMKR